MLEDCVLDIILWDLVSRVLFLFFFPHSSQGPKCCTRHWKSFSVRHLCVKISINCYELFKDSSTYCIGQNLMNVQQASKKPWARVETELELSINLFKLQKCSLAWLNTTNKRRVKPSSASRPGEAHLAQNKSLRIVAVDCWDSDRHL